MINYEIWLDALQENTSFSELDIEFARLVFDYQLAYTEDHYFRHYRPDNPFRTYVDDRVGLTSHTENQGVRDFLHGYEYRYITKNSIEAFGNGICTLRLIDYFILI